LDAIEPTITAFLEAMDALKDNYQFKSDQNLGKTMNEMEATINELMAAIIGRFENFERGTKHMWDEITAERFRKVEQFISSFHTTIGGVLCSLSLKMDAWARLFPTPHIWRPR
jgi:flagellar biosynthesis chaperone FliJ